MPESDVPVGDLVAVLRAVVATYIEPSATDAAPEGAASDGAASDDAASDGTRQVAACRRVSGATLAVMADVARTVSTAEIAVPPRERARAAGRTMRMVDRQVAVVTARTPDVLTLLRAASVSVAWAPPETALAERVHVAWGLAPAAAHATRVDLDRLLAARSPSLTSMAEALRAPSAAPSPSPAPTLPAAAGSALHRALTRDRRGDV